MAGALLQLASGAEAQYANGKQLKHEGGIDAQAWAGAPGGKGAVPNGGGNGSGDGGGEEVMLTVTLVAPGKRVSIAACTAAVSLMLSGLANVT